MNSQNGRNGNILILFDIMIHRCQVYHDLFVLGCILFTLMFLGDAGEYGLGDHVCAGLQAFSE
jgi:hypothetical protein